MCVIEIVGRREAVNLVTVKPRGMALIAAPLPYYHVVNSPSMPAALGSRTSEGAARSREATACFGIDDARSPLRHAGHARPRRSKLKGRFRKAVEGHGGEWQLVFGLVDDDLARMTTVRRCQARAVHQDGEDEHAAAAAALLVEPRAANRLHVAVPRRVENNLERVVGHAAPRGNKPLVQRPAWLAGPVVLERSHSQLQLLRARHAARLKATPLLVQQVRVYQLLACRAATAAAEPLLPSDPPLARLVQCLEVDRSADLADCRGGWLVVEHNDVELSLHLAGKRAIVFGVEVDDSVRPRRRRLRCHEAGTSLAPPWRGHEVDHDARRA
eukprot:scaffold38950_cov68-Phaeocystis_antarctica.AAC.1